MSWLPSLVEDGLGVDGLVLNKHVNDKQRKMSNLAIVAYKAWSAPQKLIFCTNCRARLGEAESVLELIFLLVFEA